MLQKTGKQNLPAFFYTLVPLKLILHASAVKIDFTR